MREISSGPGGILVAWLSLVAIVSVTEAGESPQSTGTTGEKQSRASTQLTDAQPESVRDLEAEILALSHGVEANTLNQIFAALARLERPDERAYLQQLLDAQLATLNGIPRPSGQEDLLLQIEALHLGPQATAEDLRARDQVVSAIAHITDPIRRNHLLKRLEEREHEAETQADQSSAASTN